MIRTVVAIFTWDPGGYHSEYICVVSTLVYPRVQILGHGIRNIMQLCNSTFTSVSITTDERHIILYMSKINLPLYDQ